VATEPDGRDPAAASSSFDWLTTGLLVFFVALLITVAALLVLPMVLA
jgi:hypothetical protein